MRREDVAKLLLRLAVGGLMLFHGISKVRHGISGISGLVVAHGLPHAFAYAAYIGELLAPLAVLFGVFTRAGAALIAIDMLFAVWLAHMADLFHLGKTGGYALELEALYFLGALALMSLGAGRYAVRND
jgi:putative oxidoreductase